jgi:hypothetical protein
LQTVDPNTPADRVFYPTGDISTTPVIRMAYVTVPGAIAASNTLLPLGIFRVNARYSVRGRRGTPLSLDVTFARLTQEEKHAAF